MSSKKYWGVFVGRCMKVPCRENSRTARSGFPPAREWRCKSSLCVCERGNFARTRISGYVFPALTKFPTSFPRRRESRAVLAQQRWPFDLSFSFSGLIAPYGPAKRRRHAITEPASRGRPGATGLLEFPRQSRHSREGGNPEQSFRTPPKRYLNSSGFAWNTSARPCVAGFGSP
ncbi:MAG: hypothetical protein BWY06_00576 [Candidatus Latescibacteria bacterium ADurb.Bin168]|nr:MAG: hypothetical protein BWY06_00576 [Candidatus Latescibacteria bacterium ADurb.Bin168]